MDKKAVIIHSGGMDSSICLALAAEEFGNSSLVSLSFSYHQRHYREIAAAARICKRWGIEHRIVDLTCLQSLTDNALINHQQMISHPPGEPANTLVVGRNGLMARLGAIYADHCGANCIYLGVMGLETANSGYRDCSRAYFDLKEAILKMDLANPHFEIRTPLVDLDKCQSLELAAQLGVLEYLLAETISCYEGLPLEGCGRCPACHLRNDGIAAFYGKQARPKI